MGTEILNELISERHKFGKENYHCLVLVASEEERVELERELLKRPEITSKRGGRVLQLSGNHSSIQIHVGFKSSDCGGLELTTSIIGKGVYYKDDDVSALDYLRTRRRSKCECAPRMVVV